MRTLSVGTERLGLRLTAEQVGLFQLYVRDLLEAAPRAGLTSLRTEDEVQRRHFLESLALGWLLERESVLGPRVIDIGAGGGFPGLPLKIVWPHLHLTLLEASTRKTDFLRQLVATLALSGVEVVTGRAEDIARRAEHRESYDLALARAVAPLPVLVELALPFLKVDGYLAALKGSRLAEELRASANALQQLGGELKQVYQLPTPGGVAAPGVVLIHKAAPTPERFPRRIGIPAKRPLR
ncbi:MAG TPA: 16S rRNA (guanine(527)-N(7))-methyltransferase RsmG [Dehalococcoidia bacterium]|nr:16S rRNA (guanine(527)-N(7))-methyltransferase RsmG [Dehalococcoidia bacterium]